MKTAKLFTLFIVALITATNAFSQRTAKKIDEIVKQYHDYGQFNGSVLVAEKGKIIYEKGFGLANMEWAVPNQPDTKFRIGSVTKQFTAALVLQLVEEGKIKLDAKITDYLTDYRKDTGEKVTIHQLLNHTSGFRAIRIPIFSPSSAAISIVLRISSRNLRVAIWNSSRGRNLLQQFGLYSARCDHRKSYRQILRDGFDRTHFQAARDDEFGLRSSRDAYSKTRQWL